MPDHINTLLSRYANLRPPHESTKKAVAETISRVVGVSVSPEHISIQHETAFISQLPSAARAEIRVHADRIHAEIHRETNGVVKAIR